MDKKLSIVIPIYKEVNNINRLFLRIRNSLKKINYEVIFVDDNSQDGSEKVLHKLRKKYSKLRFIIRKKIKRDLSQSCFDGINFSNYKNILIMDGDLQHDPKYIPKMFKIYNKTNADVVVGARDLLKGENPGLGIIRKLSSIVILFFFNLIDKKTIDPMSGFFLFKKTLYKKNKKRFLGEGYKILSDILYNSKNKIIVKDFVIIFKRRLKDKSKMNYKILLMVIKLYIFIIFKKLF